MTRSFVQLLESRMLLSRVSVVPSFHDAVQAMAITMDSGSLAAQFGKVNLPPEVVAGATLRANVPVVLSASGGAFKGTAQITFSANTSTSLDGNEVMLGSAPRKLSLGSRGSITVNFKIKSLPATLPDGTYYILADVEDSSGGFNVIATTQTITVAQPSDSLTPESAIVHADGGGIASVRVEITNTGNSAPASGKSIVQIFSSPDGVSEDTLLTTISLALPLRANQSRVFSFHLNASEQAQAGSDGYLVFDIYDPSGNVHTYGIADSAPASSGNYISQLVNLSHLDLFGSATYTHGPNAGQTFDSLQIAINNVDDSGNITGNLDGGFTTTYVARSLRNAKVTATGRFSAQVVTTIVSTASLSGQFSIDQATGVVTLTGTFRGSGGKAAGTFTAD